MTLKQQKQIVRFFIISQLGSLRSIGDSRRFNISYSIFFSQLSPYCLKRARSGSIRLDAAFEDLIQLLIERYS